MHLWYKKELTNIYSWLLFKRLSREYIIVHWLLGPLIIIIVFKSTTRYEFKYVVINNASYKK